MSTKITPKDVLAYLNYLGYKNVNAYQLKEFIKDLKKLIKYEEKKKSRDNLRNATSTPNINEEHCEPQQELVDIFSALHSHGTFASNAKAVPKKESVISVQIKKSKCQCKQQGQESKKCSESNVRSDKENENVPERAQPDENLPLKENQSNLKVDSKVSVGKKSNLTKPKSSFIRPLMSGTNKSDPVALYHQYQAGWKRQKVPGEDNRTELRWAIRERMLGSRA